ncbi:MAG: glycerophosphodiester phosphodiesterase family protein [Gammaproteobacteria bacterium]
MPTRLDPSHSPTPIKLPRVTAHRGGAAHAPENTLTAICSAQAANASWIEMDVSLLGDGTPVIFHDESVNRCTNGTGLLREHTVTSIADLDAGSWFSPRFVGERIPTLRDASELIRDLDLFLNLEIKLHGEDQREPLANRLREMCGAGELDARRTLLSSFDLDALRFLRREGCHLSMAALFDELPEDWGERVEGISPVSINLDHDKATVAQIEAIIDQGYHVQLYTVNDPERVRHLRGNPSVGIITDDPMAFSGW